MNGYYLMSAICFLLFIGYHIDPGLRKSLDEIGQLMIMIIGAPFILGGSRFGEYLMTSLLTYGALKLDGR